MSDKLVVPGSDEFCRFVEAFFSDVDFELDEAAKSGHDVYRIPSHPHNIAVPRNRKRLANPTFDGLLDDLVIDRATYRRLAGTPSKLKTYCKKRKREAEQHRKQSAQ